MKKIITEETVIRCELADYIAKALKAGATINSVTPCMFSCNMTTKEAVSYTVETVKEEI